MTRLLPHVYVRGPIDYSTPLVERQVRFDIESGGGARARYVCSECGHPTNDFPSDTHHIDEAYSIPPGIEREMVQHVRESHK